MGRAHFYVVVSRKGVAVYRQTKPNPCEHVAEDCGEDSYIVTDLLDSDVLICTIQRYATPGKSAPLFELGTTTMHHCHLDTDNWNTTARVAVWIFGPGPGWSSNEAAYHAAELERTRASLIFDPSN